MRGISYEAGGPDCEGGAVVGMSVDAGADGATVCGMAADGSLPIGSPSMRRKKTVTR
ncbi:hypothetical protein ACFVXE_35980 [Streptomyces sp. NPDC058231]|uniref:hypothetical protein n=1 Tax=Streptomyces sp. NPDC058231 TaxID=3346392 RepID=UPI0036E99B7D